MQTQFLFNICLVLQFVITNKLIFLKKIKTKIIDNYLHFLHILSNFLVNFSG